MKRSVIFKVAVIGCLMLLLMIPVQMISGVIGERKNRQELVVDEIAQSTSYSQRLLGPVLVVPYYKRVRETKVDPTTNNTYIKETIKNDRLYFLPSAFVVDGKIKTERRARGIYEAKLYHADNNISGHFDVPEQYGIHDNWDDYHFEPPYITMGIKDIRGIENALKIRVDDQLIDMEPGSKIKQLGEGVHAPLRNLDTSHDQRLNFSLNLVLRGTSALTVAPVGKDTRVQLAADWPHPSFMGSFLPLEHQIDPTGFSAHWQTSYFASNFAELFEQCHQDAACTLFPDNAFGVSFIDPVDQYVKSDRAIKYAILFIGLTFAAFFLFEVLKRLVVHPVQYSLVGLALAIFYLLLISLSEHIAFGLAYMLSSAACILLIGFYVRHVLKSLARCLVFSSCLAALYGLLFCLLSAEDYALLMGALLLFVSLGAFMVLTRQLDWYAVGKVEKLDLDLPE